jgi:dUTP pyrophosphatase
MHQFRVQKLDPEALIPTRANEGDAGLDLYALHDCVIHPKYREVVGTGIAVQIPKGYAGLVTPRSGLAKKFGVTVMNTPGLIDSGYRGEVGVILYNAGRVSYYVTKHERIAQLVITSVPNFVPIEVDQLSETQRGEEGFGSSGN